MLRINTRHFGEISIDECEILTFSEGLPGFEDVRQFALLGGDKGQAPFFWLQSIDRPDLALVVVDPFIIYPEYTVDVDDSDIEVLKIRDVEKILTLCIVVIPEEIREMRANLKAPILINLENNTGKQVLQHSDTLPIRYFLLQ